MPTATLTFQLPEESEEHQLALNAGKMDSVLREFDEHLRSLVKYDHKGVDSQTVSTLRDELHTFLDDKGLRL